MVLVVIVSGVLVAGCGAGGPTAAGVSQPTTPRASARPSTTAGPSAGSSAGGGHPNALAFAKCMRANGVPAFPDPEPGGGFLFHASAAVMSSPAFRAAQSKCRALMPTPSGAGQNSSPSAQTLAKLRQVAQCMRRHGVPDFPDPRTTRPANLSLGPGRQYSEITNYEGAWLLFPATIDMQSPAWKRAAAACGPLAESLNHPH